MSLVLSNVRLLLNSLRENDWYITAFDFNFNNHDYVVVFEDLREIDKGDEYYAVLLTFIDKADNTRILSTYANSYDFKKKGQEIMDFFGINPTPYSKMPFWSLYSSLNTAMPTEYHPLDQKFKKLVVTIVDQRDGSKGFCCYKIARNGKTSDGRQKYRTAQNTAKTKLLRSSLFNLIGHENVSFYYRKENELSDAEILSNFGKIDRR